MEKTRLEEPSFHEELVSPDLSLLAVSRNTL